MNEDNLQEIILKIKAGNICVMPTDTLYGFSCSALIPKAVEKIYDIKERDRDKPFIILISDIDELQKFKIHLNTRVAEYLSSKWPAPLTVVLPCSNDNFTYLHRGKNTLAFRIPDFDTLQTILKETGPLVSTTVNISGQEPLNDISTITTTFGNKVDFVVNNGVLNSLPSTIISIDKDKINMLRSGTVNIDETKIN